MTGVSSSCCELGTSALALSSALGNRGSSHHGTSLSYHHKIKLSWWMLLLMAWNWINIMIALLPFHGSSAIMILIQLLMISLISVGCISECCCGSIVRQAAYSRHKPRAVAQQLPATLSIAVSGDFPTHPKHRSSRLHTSTYTHAKHRIYPAKDLSAAPPVEIRTVHTTVHPPLLPLIADSDPSARAFDLIAEVRGAPVWITEDRLARPQLSV